MQHERRFSRCSLTTVAIAVSLWACAGDPSAQTQAEAGPTLGEQAPASVGAAGQTDPQPGLAGNPAMAMAMAAQSGAGGAAPVMSQDSATGSAAGAGGQSLGGAAGAAGNAAAPGTTQMPGVAGAGTAMQGAAGAGDTATPDASSGAPASGCGSGQPQHEPFGCTFAWGTNDPGGSLDAFAGLQFMSKWVGYEIDGSGNLPRCDGCSWLREQVASTALVPVYYAYFIGYFGKANGLPDGNENPNGPNLTTDAAKLIRAQRPKLVGLYRDYAKQTAAAWPDKPLVWLLEGDFVQYTADSQKEALSYAELADLAQEISCAIKSEMPHAVVAINHSTWNSDEITNTFWNAMRNVSYDLVWTTGVANNDGFFEMGADPSTYNAATATYAYVHELTKRKLFVDTSFGLTEMADSWSSADAATLNARIDEGVIAANVTKPPAGYLAKVMALDTQLTPVCQ